MATIKKQIGGSDADLDRRPRNLTSVDNTAFLADYINGLVANRAINFKEQMANQSYGGLVRLLGNKKASDIALKIAMYNQNPNNKALTPQERVAGFYETLRADPVIEKVRSFGYGVIPTVESSPNEYVKRGRRGSVDAPADAVGVDMSAAYDNKVKKYK